MMRCIYAFPNRAPIRGLFGLGLVWALGLQLCWAEGDITGITTPSAAHLLPLRLRSVDAIRGNLNLTLGNSVWTITKMDQGELVRTIHVARAGVLEGSAVTWTAGGLMLNRGQGTFGYDELQRLKTAHVLNPQTGIFVDQSFVYDRFGNRTISNTTAAVRTLAANSEALSWTASYANGSLLSAVTVASVRPANPTMTVNKTGCLYIQRGGFNKYCYRAVE